MTYDEYSYPTRNNRFIFSLLYYLGRTVPLRYGQSLLSIGSGDGVHEQIFKSIVGSLNVFELNNVERYDAEKDKIPYEAESFDFVFIKSVIEHIRNTDLFLSEIRRVLKKGGKVIILTPDYQRQKDFFFDDYTHVKPFTRTSLNMALLLNNFKVKKCDWFFYYKAIWEGYIAPNLLPIRFAYWLTQMTGIKYFRWGADRQLFAIGEKE
jgi:SAM-dependent methyltransferase